MTPYYEDALVTLYHGDCREWFSEMPQVVDHIITDAPYDATTHKNARTLKDGEQRVNRIEIDFDPLDVEKMVPLFLSYSRRWSVCFCSMEMLGQFKAASGDGWVRSGFWHRLHGAPQMSGDRPAQPGEGIAIMHNLTTRKAWNRGGHPAFWARPVTRRGRNHPTEKPLLLMHDIVSAFTDPGELILDPYAGSGTTLVACKGLGRRAIGIELNEAYCEDTAERLSSGAQMSLLEIPDVAAAETAPL